VGLWVLPCIVCLLKPSTNLLDTNQSLVIQAVFSQDLATHGYYTEPNTGIIFYTSSEANGAVQGDGEFSTVSLGGYTFGIALPANAMTVDATDYIGLLVSPIFT